MGNHQLPDKGYRCNDRNHQICSLTEWAFSEILRRWRRKFHLCCMGSKFEFVLSCTPFFSFNLIFICFTCGSSSTLFLILLASRPPGVFSTRRMASYPFSLNQLALLLDFVWYGVPRLGCPDSEEVAPYFQICSLYPQHQLPSFFALVADACC